MHILVSILNHLNTIKDLTNSVVLFKFVLWHSAFISENTPLRKTCLKIDDFQLLNMIKLFLNTEQQ